MAIFALQYLAGGFLDEDLQHFNKKFDDWCVSFDNYEDALTLAKTLPNSQNIDIDDNIICVVEPFIGSNFRIAVCNLKTKKVRFLKTHYKTIPSIEVAFANFKEQYWVFDKFYKKTKNLNS